jgi:hypothetical protein
MAKKKKPTPQQEIARLKREKRAIEKENAELEQGCEILRRAESFMTARGIVTPSVLLTEAEAEAADLPNPAAPLVFRVTSKKS